MTITKVSTDPDALTMTLVAVFDASPERVWQLWADRGQLERWWAPPPYRVSFAPYDLAPGSRIAYEMSGDGSRAVRAYWDLLEAASPHRLVFRDGFADDDGSPNEELTSESVVTIEAGDDGRSRMTIVTTFADRETMERAVASRMVEGFTAAVRQIGAILADDPIRR